jgi:predicted esterase
MTRKHSFVFVILVSLFFLLTIGKTAYSEEKTGDKVEYQKIRQKFGTLYKEKKYKEAAELLQKNWKHFPEKTHATAWNLAITYKQLKQYKRGIKALKRALKTGVWYSIYAFRGEFFKPYRDLKAFQEVIDMNNRLRDEAQKKAKPQTKVVLPEGYSGEKKYPLFLALHGGGENIETFEPRWKSQKLSKEFITVFLQSSQVVSMTGFSWENEETTKKEISEAFAKIMKDYSVDKKEILIGGFSSGGFATLITVFSNIIPATGFIILCPPMPEGINQEDLNAAKERGLRGTLLTTEMDPRIGKQRAMIDMFKKAGLQYQLVVFPNIGHWYPKDLDKKIDMAIDHIRYK